MKMNKFIYDFIAAFVVILMVLFGVLLGAFALVWMLANFSAWAWIILFITLFAGMYAIGENDD